MSFKTELETARADAERRRQRQAEDQAKQAQQAHIMVTDPDRYWAEYALTDEAVIQAIRGGGSFSITLPEAAFGSQTAKRLDDFRETTGPRCGSSTPRWTPPTAAARWPSR